MSVEIAWKQNILVTDFHLLKSLLVVLGFGSQAFICGFSRQNINSVQDCSVGLKVRQHGEIFQLIFIKQLKQPLKMTFFSQYNQL